jgi:predicted protein tyrosine phosphatase
MTDNTTTLKVLFVCEANRLRSPTAETIFSGYPGVEAKSAGVGKGATVPVSAELLDWADLVFVMEKRHRNIIHSRFKEIYQRKRIICLYIPDEFEFMDPELVQLLEEKVTPYIDRSGQQNMVDR